MVDEASSANLMRSSIRQLIATDWRWLTALFLLALAVRAPWLGRADLWCDEILFVGLASPPLTPGGVLNNFWAQFLSIGHLPFGALLHNLLVWPFADRVADISHATTLQRIPALLFGSLEVPVLYLLARVLTSRRVACIAASLMALLVFPVFFSREAYFYSPLMFFATASVLTFMTPILNGALTRLHGLVLFFLMAATSLTHINGSTIGLGAVVILLCCLLVNRYPGLPRDWTTRKLFLKLLVICAAGTLASAPFFMQKIGRPSPMNFVQQPSLLEIYADFSGKTLLGLHPVGVGIASILLILGVVAVFADDKGRSSRCVLLATFLVPFVIILISANKTLYFARYFSGVLGLYYLILALGIDKLVIYFSKYLPIVRRCPDATAVVFTALLVIPSVALFIPQLYQLPAKGVDYGGISSWLTKNLAPGTPYVMESAYELRFTSGYFPTPGLIPAAPYVHGAGPAELERLRSRQRDFLLEYPEAPFIESARHGTEIGATSPVWTWPHEHFRQRYDLVNEPMKRLAFWGVWPQSPGRALSVIQYHTPIWWNSPADSDALLMANGESVKLKYPGWQVQSIKKGEYARVIRGARGMVLITNLTSHPAKGYLILDGIMSGTAGATPDVQMLWMGNPVGAEKQLPGRLWTMRSDVFLVPASGEGRFDWGVPPSQAAGVAALGISRMRFVPVPESGKEPPIVDPAGRN